MWNQWDETVFPKILDERITFRGSLGQEKIGYQGLSEYMDFIKAAFPDFHNEIELIITEFSSKLIASGAKGSFLEDSFEIMFSSGTSLKRSDDWHLGEGISVIGLGVLV